MTLAVTILVLIAFAFTKGDKETSKEKGLLHSKFQARFDSLAM
jgi:hypothetical protein